MSKEVAKQIREAIKSELGLGAKQVSVRASNSSVTVTIKTRGVSKDAVESIAQPFERVDRCHVSGEALCGGNTFVFVDYSRDVESAMVAEIDSQIPSVGETSTINGLRVTARPAGYFVVVSGDTQRNVWGKLMVAKAIQDLAA